MIFPTHGILIFINWNEIAQSFIDTSLQFLSEMIVTENVFKKKEFVGLVKYNVSVGLVKYDVSEK